MKTAAAPIAIIGIGLRLPGADTLDGLWGHLAAARSLISEVPRQRWDKHDWRGNPAQGNKTNSIWGGFLADADGFDAGFFNVSPREAAWMDPQQRFALEMAWHAIEDAGYAASALAGSKTGVFMGVCHWDYAELLEKHLAQLDAYAPTGIAFSIIANRVSHFFDFHGPSVTNDTACAASLTALHDAVRALQTGACDQALAGGVNLIWSPNHFVSFAKAGMLSKDGRAKAFDEAADGYVRGEGGAVVLLKPLARALADGDPIHAVIRGIGINHGGRTNSLTVTNPKAQADLIVAVHQGAGITPDTLSYIEAHGPGTPLGDPIEIAGLKDAFARLHADAGSIAAPDTVGIGSVKTNMGHLEGAAGIAGLAKVLAALRHGTLPANVGFQTLNRLITLDNTPFRIQAQASPWPRADHAPRRAAISSFGFGGSNAHVVVEDAPPAVTAADFTGPYVLPLSAKDEPRLRLLAATLADFIASHPDRLAALAHTLQSGRETLEIRRAVTVADATSAQAALRAIATGQDVPASGLGGRWANGESVDWVALWPAGPPPRIHAPLYPFDRQRHWFDESVGAKDDRALPHPLLHHNLSDFAGIHFQTRLKGTEFFWAEHHVGGVQVLPGVAALEMVRAAIERAQGGTTGALRFENVVWAKPVLAGDGPTLLDVHLVRQDDGGIAFSLRQDSNDGSVANCQGVVRTTALESAAVTDLAALRAAHPTSVDVADCYAKLRASGVEHGPSFQALAQVHAGQNQVLAQLKLPRRLLPGLESMKLHPVLLDAAIQAWVGLDNGAMAGAAVPFACGRLDVHGPCDATMWAHVRAASVPGNNALRKLDIDLYGKDGQLRLSWRDLSLRVMAPEDKITTPDHPTVLAQGTWQPAPLGVPRSQPMDVLMVSDFPAADDWASAVPAWYASVYDRLSTLLRAKPRQRTQVQVIVADDVPACLTAPLAALLRIAALEQPKLDGVLIRVAGPLTAVRRAALSTAESRRRDGWSEIRYDADDTRQAWVLTQTTLAAAAPVIDPDGVYWITGGLGGLGRLFIDWLRAHGAQHIAVSGRSDAVPPDGVRYIRCDLGDAAAVQRTLAALGPVKGIIHAAGILDDGFIITRPAESTVFAAKVAGTLNVDAASRVLDLDFLVLCSSVAAVFGNAGQAGYGAANAFLDAFAEHRNRLVATGQRHGRTHAIAWPLWAEGGMRADAATLAALHRQFGTVPMPAAAGLDALDRILAAGAERVTVLHGDIHTARRAIAETGVVSDDPAEPMTVDTSDLARRTQDFVRDILAEVLHLEPGQIRVNRKLDEYGLDSIAIVDATNRLEEALGPLSKTLFFEYVDLAGIAAHLSEEYAPALAKALGDSPAVTAVPAQALTAAAPVERQSQQAEDTHDIAIIGLSLKVAKAEDQQSFWDMLAQGLHGFEPYPTDRWDHAALLHPERDVLGKTVVKTGCFLDDIAAFDPRYFRISQYEAELMSPEVRLFLQNSVEAFEDAGYSRETMQRQLGGDVAVIMGSMTNEYDLYGFQNMLMRGALASGSYTGTIPNMVSYFYGFTGPSYFLDTMCSAASTCVHEAVHMLRAGRCKMALAGGVSLLLHPQKLIATSQEHFTSKTAEVIRGYGLGADGTILGEGVGAVVLKTLADAKRDGDHIYGVIRGTAISNAGIRNGFTVPNPRQQAVAIEQALDDAGIDAATISYVEGHGSGTALGDPIEIKALTQAFRKHTDTIATCPIGTVKSNIAHLLAASGLAGIAKVLMQMKHGQLAPSLHAETLNPNIAFDTTPFRVQRTLEPWRRRRDANGVEIPRRAGVTSIGAGGMNSHIIIEEYIAPPAAPQPDEAQVLVFSAMTEAALVNVIRRFRDHLDGQSLGDLAFTLQVGKNELPCRLALVATSLSEATERLAAFIAQPGPMPGLLYTRSILDADPMALDSAECDPSRIAAAWISGAAIDWPRLHQGRQRRRLSLPAYPFDKVRCWYPQFDDAPSVVRPMGPGLKLHPLIGSNQSDLGGLRYRTALHLSELQDYVFKAQRQPVLLPLAAVEAMAATARIAGLSGPLSLTDIRLNPQDNWAEIDALHAAFDGDCVRVETQSATRTLWAQSRVAAVAAAPSTMQPILGQRHDGAALYGQWKQQGLDFHPYLEVIDHAHGLDTGGIICRLRTDLPQQDHYQQRVQIAATAWAAGFQALLLVAPGQQIATIAAFRLEAHTDAIAQVLVQPAADGFELFFLAADGAVLASAKGMRTAQTAEAETTTPESQPQQTSQTRLAMEVRDLAAALLKFPPDQIGLRDAFHDLGFDSISLTRLAEAISTAYGITLSPAVFFECEHLEALSAHLIARHAVAAAKSKAAATTAFRPPTETISAPSPTPRRSGDIDPRRSGDIDPRRSGDIDPRRSGDIDPRRSGDIDPRRSGDIDPRRSGDIDPRRSGDIDPRRSGDIDPRRSGDIAIISMAGRFPGAADAEALFDHLLAGDDLTNDLPLERYGTAYAARMAAADFPKRGGFLSDIDRFDAAFFRVSPLEAERMDPQQRLLLEVIWRVLEQAGYGPDELPADTAVLVGASSLDYGQLLHDHAIACDGYVATGNSLAMIANRVSHVLNVHGPSQTVDTACSSSLIALLRAAEVLRNGTCSAALVGGVNLTLTAEGFEGPHQAGMLAADGRCKSFGAAADGYGRGEGVAALLLKRLDDAERDGDHILGLLIGGAENHGGRAGSLTAPNVNAQAALIEAAMAGIDGRSVSYIEAHGTGTALGDPVEINGLRRAYASLLGSDDTAEPFIGLGSLKSNIGHLEAAAGLAGVIKVLMAMRHEMLPASLHCAEINPHLDLTGSPFYLLRANRAWPADGPRRAGVSSFGFGGANAHVVLQDYRPTTAPRRPQLPPRVFADTRFWLKRAEDKTVVMVPHWHPAPAAMAATKPRRLVLSVGQDIAAGHGADIVALDTFSYERAAIQVLENLRRVMGGPDTLVQLVLPLDDERRVFAGLGAMLDTAVLESSRLSAQVVEIAEPAPADDLARLLAADSGGPGRLRHVRGQRLTQSWRELPPAAAPHVWTPGAVTLITGGLGALGRILALDIATTAPGSVLVLTGSGGEDAERAGFVTRLRNLGAIVAYRRVDMADDAAIHALVRNIVEVHGRLDTVIHCAGRLRDGYIARKDSADLSAVLAPKAGGAAALVQACAGLKLDKLVLFASIAGIAGNDGQVDYAAANGYLDALAQAHGLPLVAVDWPLWAEGGMRIDAATAQSLYTRMGQRPLSSEQGLAALHRILAAAVPQAAVLAGDETRIRDFFAHLHQPATTTTAAAAVPVGHDNDRLAKAVAAELAALFSTIGGYAPGTIHADTALEEYGIDSLMITRLNTTLGDVFATLPKTLFFEYRTLAQVAAHLAHTQAERCQRWTGRHIPPVTTASPAPTSGTNPAKTSGQADDPIAIIGLAGHYPGSTDLESWWQALADGRDLIGEIPPERWSLDGFFHPDRDEAIERGLSYAKWGAFLDGFADFDPLFFKIAARDAAAMDPQERLLLMTAWEACEDAGYSPQRLAAACPGEYGAKVGVFIGVTKTGYALHGPFAGEGGGMVRPATSFASMANRISHVLNLSGPSLPVDTMCSSSLTAIHEACEHLRGGAIGMAVVGGVNLYLHPSNFIELSAARMLSPDGRCRSFGRGANGFVPGEGVGCVVLKPLSQALADGDQIHAVIRASAVNHGGHTNGYTVPNPVAQRHLVQDALAAAGLSAADITCVEAHGTGTELGDPIEIAALTQAFAAHTERRHFCALGSVKSNMGHLEAAAGIAGLTKVLLQMKHGQLAPTLHAEEINPNLDLDNTPFVLQRTLAPWNGRRIAGISSFGAGGANAHIIVEAWDGETTGATKTAPQAIIVSARDPQRLRRQVQRLIDTLDRPVIGDPRPRLRQALADILAVAPDQIGDTEDFTVLGLDAGQHLALHRWIERHYPTAIEPESFAHLRSLEHVAVALAGQDTTAAPALADIAFTLQVGRAGQESRLALEAISVADMVDKLRRWLADGSGPHQGESNERHALLDTLGGAAEAQAMIAAWWEQGRLDRILNLWTKGIDVPWHALPRPDRVRVVPLPATMFDTRQFWLPQATSGVAGVITAAQGDAALQAEAARLETAIAAILGQTLAALAEDSIVPAYRRWHQAVRKLLAGHASAVDPWTTWAQLRRTGPAPQMDLAETTLRALPDILTGRRAATAVMFPDGTMGLVEAVYKANAVAARFSRTLAAAAAAFVHSHPGRALRIIEIGAGTGGTSEPVLAALAPQAERIAEYCYTDLSRAFLIHAERRYAPQWPQLRTALLDVEKPLAGQNINLGSYDLVIAANVLHATADMTRTMGHVCALLAPGGMVLINETSMATLFTHVTFGLLDGWWRFTDPELRIPGTPSLAPQTWQTLLTTHDLAWVAGSTTAECALGQQILAARAPGTPTGTLATRVPPVRPAEPQTAIAAPPLPAAGLRQRLLAVLGETLNVAPATIVAERSFADYGLDSILGADLVHRLRRDLGVDISQTDLFDFTNVTQLEAFLARQSPAPTVPAVTTTAVTTTGPKPREPIAIVGFSGRFAGSPDADALWAHLLAGDDLVGPVTRFAVPVPKGMDDYGRHGSFIGDVEAFDPVFFGISGLEATYMDPQQRLFLEEAWKTLEHAGHAGPAIQGSKCGVFVGCSSGDYQELFDDDVPGQAFWGNTSSLIPARIAYFLDLKGPAVAVDTACSSSLVAVHMACRSLWDGESELALAGGVFIQSTARFFRSANQARMLSPSGNCAAFGANADGIVPGEAVGAVLLRPLSAALADGDTIHGLIIGSGLNQDGTTNGITAPSALSQERLIRQVQSEFAIDPASIDLIEAHGTGTPLGDPIEHAALARAFAGLPARSCALGSVKSNIGHATTAAGIAGLIKVVQSLKHATIPATLHFNGGNPAISFTDGPFFVNDTAQPWASDGRPRRAGISSFGFSGTNAHVVVEQAPAQPCSATDNGPHRFVLSARTLEQLRQSATALAAHLDLHPELAAADVAFTLAVGRRPLHHRLSVHAAGIAELIASLRQWLDGQAPANVQLCDADHQAPVPAPRTGRRVPLPTYPFARLRHWVKPAPTIAAAAEIPLSLPLHLDEPARLSGPFTPQAWTGPVTLQALTASVPGSIPGSVPGGTIEHLGDADGVRRLRLNGTTGLAQTLAQAGADTKVRVVLIEAAADGLGAMALPCAVPVVTTFSAADADFPARSPAEAAVLAGRIANAPRLALVELKAAMRQPGRLPPAMTPKLDRLAAPASGPTTGTRVPLTSPCMELELFADGIALLRLNERGQKNSFTDLFMDGIAEAFTVIAHRDDAKVVVLTGFDGYFACGGTREGLNALQQGATRFTDRKIYALPQDCPLPVIAAMQGHAIGAGWSLGMFCDHTLFAAEGVYHSNYLWYGFTPGAGATLIFPHRLGDDLGREVLFTAHEYRGRDLAARSPSLPVLPAAQVLPAALALAHGLAKLERKTLTDWKSQSRAAIAERLPAVFAQELAMHEKTFIGNDRVRERIERMFPSAPETVTAPIPDPATTGQGQVRRLVIDSLAEDLMIAASDIRDSAGFLELGLDSILAVTWVRKLGTLVKQDLPATIIYAHPTVGALINHLAGPAAPIPAAPIPAPATTTPANGDLRQRVIASLAEDLMIAASDIRDSAGFLELGLDSILAVTWVRRLSSLLGLDLPATIIYAHPTVGALIEHLAGQAAPVQAPLPPVSIPLTAPVAAPISPSPVAPPVAVTTLRRDRTDRSAADAVAIIGASGRFPKAVDLDAFWDNIRHGRDCIDEVPADRWDISRFYHPDPAHPGTSSCRWMGAIDDVDCFDAAFFTITPREAQLMDPQQRLFLQHAWQAIEDGGLNPAALAGTACGIFVGAGPSGYANLIDEHNAYSLLGSSGSILAARIAHLLDLRGPCLSLDTACSSSLVAIAEACNSLLLGDSDLALAGGVSVMIGPEMFIDTSKVGMLSADGRCFSFDSRANGFVPGEGAGVLLLKRLDDAQRDGDPIHAVIRGWGINQDGRTNGITAPNPQAQTRLIRQVQDRFGIDAASIGLIECHGTGTPLGDPIEIEGLTDAFTGLGDRPGSCALGSVKSNVGHLLAAAGIAGAIKAMLAVEHGEMPPSINFNQLNEHIRLNGTPFAVNTGLKPWPRPANGPRRAAVSAFGFSGTNAHLVLEEHAPAAAAAQSGPWVFTLSARTLERLSDYAGQLERFVAGHADIALGDIAHTLQVGRKALNARLAFVFTDRDFLLRALASVVAGQPLAGLHLSTGDAASIALFERDDDARTLADKWLNSRDPAKLDKVAALWAKGLTVEWPTPPQARRRHVPVYPFARDRHWVETAPPPPEPLAAPTAHPLLDILAAPARLPIVVRGDEEHLTSTLHGTEKLLLGLFLPELVRAAAERESGRPVRGLRHLLWGRPVRVNGHARTLEVVLANDGDDVLYHVAVDGDDNAPCHVGEILAAAPVLPAAIEPATLRHGTDVSDDFRAFANGLATHCGPPAPMTAQVHQVWCQGEILVAQCRRVGSTIALPLDPLVLDPLWRLAAFRANGWRRQTGPLAFPAAMQSLWAERPVPTDFFVRVDADSLSVVDGSGAVCILLTGVHMSTAEHLSELCLTEEIQS